MAWARRWDEELGPDSGGGFGQTQAGTQAGSQADGQGTLSGLDAATFGPEIEGYPGVNSLHPPLQSTNFDSGVQIQSNYPVAPAATDDAAAGTDRTARSGTEIPTYDVTNSYLEKLAALRSARTPQDRAVAQDDLARDLYTSLKAAGHDVKWDGDQLIVDGRPYMVAGTGYDDYAPTGMSTYQPGEIPMEDVPDFSFEDLMAALADPLGEEANRRMLENPYSITDLDVAKMKATSKDELAEMELENQDRLTTLGADYGIQESPWLAAQELAGRRDTDRSMVLGNRAIEASALQTRKADEHKALEANSQYQAGRVSKVNAAATQAISAAAARGDRMALREQVNQRAAELNISAEKVLADFVSQKLERDLRWDISEAQLSQSDKEHLESLAMQLEELAQREAQFKASYAMSGAELAETSAHNQETERIGWAGVDR